MRRRSALRLSVVIVWVLLLGLVACERSEPTGAKPSSPATAPASPAPRENSSRTATTSGAARATAVAATEPATATGSGSEKASAQPGAASGGQPSPAGSSSKTAAAAGSSKDSDEEPAPKPHVWGPPLVENAKDLTKLSPSYPVWLDAKQKRVVMVGGVCRATMGLEMFACLLSSEKDYESVVVVDTKAAIVHAALLALGAKPGEPTKWQPRYRPAWGTEIAIDLVWKDAQGKQHRARAQEWIRDVNSGKPLPNNWVFAGSGFWKDPQTGEEHYLGEGGYLICVANTSSAVLDLPIRSSSGLENREFVTNNDTVPPQGTEVTLILTPQFDKPVEKPKEKDEE